jgi:hypothetical protein
MLGSAILDTATGVAFAFLLLNLIASAVREAVEVWTRSRVVHLQEGICELLDQGGVKGLAEDFYQHPLVASLYDPAKPKDRPSYIPARNFALALLDMAARGERCQGGAGGCPDRHTHLLDSIRRGVQTIQNVPVQRAILTAVDSAEDSLAAAQRNRGVPHAALTDPARGA